MKFNILTRPDSHATPTPAPHQHTSSGFINRLAWIIFLLASQWVHAEPEPAKSGPMLRIMCVATLPDVENEELVIASRNEEGQWLEHSTVELRSSFVSKWLPAAHGTLHLAARDGKELVSKCQFTYPQGARRAMLVMLPDPSKNSYKGDVINPEKLAFSKGSTLLVNYSTLDATVRLGTKQESIKPGQRSVIKAVPEANRMFRMLVAYTNEAQKLVPCYDRYVGYNPEARDFLLLFPDARHQGISVYNLAEFGPFE